MDSTEALETKELPKSLAIIGGGIIGMEFAFIYASFGVEVSVIEFLDDILSMLDTDLRRQIAPQYPPSGNQALHRSEG